ncbi:MAG TPA: biotin--[acetyl-CoA-carboxylase] ligase [Treponemataceae bacterium]|nr:biotin--[acetyl-CoA-carboxylase] ligase [Treponemataceae bacterium]
MKTTERVLALLKKNKHKIVSGECIAKKLNISRTSVWKAVQILKKDGYVIKAKQNAGYVLEKLVDVLDTEHIITDLSEEAKGYTGTKIEIFKELDSTNNEAKKRLSISSNSKKCNGIVLIADKQTNGRGRLGRTFYSPSHNGMYMSLIVTVDQFVFDTTIITALAAVAVCRVLQTYNLKPKIKWVNDIFIHDKKVCGILTEGSINLETGLIDTIILGIGLNVFSTKMFSKELQKIAGAVFESKKDIQISRNKIIAKTINELYAVICNPTLISLRMQEYRNLSFIISKNVIVSSGSQTYEARVIDITPEAHLLIKTQNGDIKEIVSGEVSLTPIR